MEAAARYLHLREEKEAVPAALQGAPVPVLAAALQKAPALQSAFPEARLVPRSEDSRCSRQEAKKMPAAAKQREEAALEGRGAEEVFRLIPPLRAEDSETLQAALGAASRFGLQRARVRISPLA